MSSKQSHPQNKLYTKSAMPRVGIVEWFRPGEHERVKQVLADLDRLGVNELRTGISWADWHTKDGQKWYEWMIPHIAAKVNVLPCFLYTPPSLGIAPKTSSPPRDPKTYADFIDLMIKRFGEFFEWVELWNEPNNIREWDYTLDADWQLFSEMIGGAAYWAQQLGKKTVLGGMSPIDPSWLRLMFKRGVMKYIDAIGIHGFPGTFEYSWEGWKPNIDKLSSIISENNSNAKIWITEAGFSTWRHDEHTQLKEFMNTIEAPVDRVYWYALHDLCEELPTIDGFHSDEREYHFGLKREDGSSKLLCRLWENEGLNGIKSFKRYESSPAIIRSAKPAVLITGGAGFIGTNLAHRLASSGRSVILFDNLSRPGVERNLQWLRDTHGSQVQIEIADIRDKFKLHEAIEHVSQVFHFAAQVAVTTSLTGPVHDFEVNTRGTLNLLEAIRTSSASPSLVYTSTNKVYGALDDIELRHTNSRYEPIEAHIRKNGVNEKYDLDFHSPYGCSKGAADQYVLDYARTYGIKATVFRMSCIYGPHQFGTEDQGWVAHFLIRAIDNLPITIYGDGMQVRDVLFVEDLVDALLLAQKKIGAVSGQAFNIGGGEINTLSLIELMDIIHDLHGKKPKTKFSGWRPGDQRYYVSDTRKFQVATGWTPRVSVYEGVNRLYEWLMESRGLPIERVVDMRGVNKNAGKSVPAKTGR